MSSCCERNLKPPADRCVCSGNSLQLTCTAVGGGTTVWTVGQQCMIQLDHLQFAARGVNRSCPGTSGTQVATGRSLSVVGNCYTSQLTIVITSDLNGTSVSCGHDNGTNTESIGTYQIILTSGKKSQMSLNVFMIHDFFLCRTISTP